MTANPNATLSPEPQIGRRLDRLESVAKVTGAADYTHNLELPRMLHAKVVRSPHAHARILGIDTREAAAMPGVVHVVTAREVMRLIPDPHYGPAFHDQPILAIEKVRHVGEPVAVVLANDPHAAEAAAGLVNVDYEVLPAVFDEVEAAASKVLVHDALKPAGTFPDLKHLAGRKGTNVALDYHLRHGDADKAFAEAAHVFDHTFKTQQVMHVPMEPMVTVAEPQDGGLLIHRAPNWRLIRATDTPAYPAFYRVVWNAHVAEFSDLNVPERAHCMDVVAQVEQALRQHLQRQAATNIAATGNQQRR